MRKAYKAVLVVRMTPDQKKAIEQKAALLGVPVAAYVRDFSCVDGERALTFEKRLLAKVDERLESVANSQLELFRKEGAALVASISKLLDS